MCIGILVLNFKSFKARLLIINVFLGVLLAVDLPAQERTEGDVFSQDLIWNKSFIKEESYSGKERRHTVYITPLSLLGGWKEVTAEGRSPDEHGFVGHLIHLGYEYQFHPSFNIRGGFSYDTEAGLGIALGGSYVSRIGTTSFFYELSFDGVSYIITEGSERIKYNGIYGGQSWVIYRFVPYISLGIRLSPKQSWLVIRAGGFVRMAYALPNKHLSGFSLGGGIYWDFGIKF